MILRKPTLARYLAIPAAHPVERPIGTPVGPKLSTRLRSNRTTLETTGDATVQQSLKTHLAQLLSVHDDNLKRPERRATLKKSRKQQKLLAQVSENPEESGANVGKLEDPKPWSGDLDLKNRVPFFGKPENETPRMPLRSAPPHRLPSRTHLSYSRRVEGLLDHDHKQCIQDLTPPSDRQPIAQLAHGLDRVLFNPGVHWLRDPRSRVYNFSPYLEHIPKVTDFAFNRLTGFITSSRDEDLWELARREKRTFSGSTSSLTGMLSQIYFLVSGDKPVDVSTLSHIFAYEPLNFTPGQRMPVSVVMNYSDGVYAIDSDAGNSLDSEKNILSWLGTLLEKYLTMAPEEFASYMRSAPSTSETEGKSMREACRYAKSEKFVMRSQLDCHDSRLPGTGVFDIKTRACLPIRLDLLNFEENSGYLIRTQQGLIESFEKEYYDLIRSAFLKYSFQVRIGNMDGVIVAYHNTERMFGFQYIPLEEMDQRLFGPDPGTGDRVFDKCISILELVAEEIIRCFPQESVKCTFDTKEGTDIMNVWVEPAVWESEEERPIKQLEVKVASYLNQNPAAGARAVADVKSDWTLHWSISRLSGKDMDIRRGLAASRGRQFRAFSIPTGVDIKDVMKFWDDLNFSGKKASESNAAPIPKPKSFKKANFNIRMLRAIARKGRKETKRLEEAEEGMPKSVLGELGPVSSLVQTLAEEKERMRSWDEVESSANWLNPQKEGMSMSMPSGAKRESSDSAGLSNLEGVPKSAEGESESIPSGAKQESADSAELSSPEEMSKSVEGELEPMPSDAKQELVDCAELPSPEEDMSKSVGEQPESMTSDAKQESADSAELSSDADAIYASQTSESAVDSGVISPPSLTDVSRSSLEPVSGPDSNINAPIDAAYRTEIKSS